MLLSSSGENGIAAECAGRAGRAELWSGRSAQRGFGAHGIPGDQQEGISSITNVPTRACRSFLSVSFPGEPPQGTGHTPCCAQGQDSSPVPAATWPQPPHPGPAQPQGCPMLRNSQTPAFSARGSELWGAGLAALPAPLNSLQCCWQRLGSTEMPLLAVGQALSSRSVPYPGWRCFGKPDDFISS